MSESRLLAPDWELEYAQRIYDERPGLEVDPYLTASHLQWTPHPIQDLALESTADELLFGGARVSDRQRTRGNRENAPRSDEPVAERQVPPWRGEAKR